MVGPVHPYPPHCPYSGAPVTELGEAVVVVEGLVVVDKVVLVGGVLPPPVKPLMICATWLTIATI